MTEDFINNRDISIVAKDGDKIVGFIWCGLMAKKKYGMVDWYIIDSEHTNKDIPELLFKSLINVASKIGVEHIMISIKHTQHHDIILNNMLNFKMKPDNQFHTVMFGSIIIMERNIKEG